MRFIILGLIVLPQLIFSQIEVLSEDKIRKKAWDEGVCKRAFYVVGAFMCKKIETHLGKKGFLDALVKGPITFTHLYNSIANTTPKISIENLITL